MSRARPEGRWLWRRLYVFGLTLGLWLALDQAVRRAAAADMPAVAADLMRLMALISVLYLMAPSAQELGKLALSLRFKLGGRS